MRYNTGLCGLGAGAEGLGLVVRAGGGGFNSFAFRPSYAGWGYPYSSYSPYAPYSYYTPQYSYGDQSCPVAVALTQAQVAAVRAGQAVPVIAQDRCGKMVTVTVTAAAY